MEMNDLLRRKWMFRNYARLHTPEVGGKKRYNGVQLKCRHSVISITLVVSTGLCGTLYPNLGLDVVTGLRQQRAARMAHRPPMRNS